MDNSVYLSYDADSAGSRIGQAVLANDPDMLNEFSQKIGLGNEIIAKWAMAHGGIQYSSGGDQGVFAIPETAIEQIEALRKDYQFATGLTITVGIGKTLSESGKALIVGKFRGKNQIVIYGPDVDQEIDQAEAHIQEGTASFEEQKLAQAYLKPEGDKMAKDTEQQDTKIGHSDCPYCQALQDEGVEDMDHCQWCHNKNEEHDCPYCAELKEEHDPKAEGHPSDCPLCADMEQDHSEIETTAGPTVSEPTTTSAEDFEGAGLPTPDLPKPDAISQVPDELGTSIDDPSVENLKLESEQAQQEPDQEQSQAVGKIPEGSETPEQILEQVDLLPDQNEIQDGSDKEMEDGVSRPNNFASNVPKDMGLSEDEDENEESGPDITSVLQEGLDSHADNIQKEKVVQMVGQALQGFKACRDIIERSQQQAPQLYQSSIMMLKAMIEMAKMLGLDQGDQDTQNPLGAPEKPETAEDKADHAAEQTDSEAPSEEGESEPPKLQGQ